MSDPTQHTGDEVTENQLREAIWELASGAVVRLDDEGQPRLVRDLPQPSAFFDVLMHRGWLDRLPNGGTFKLSDAGMRAYLRSTDELGDGRLLHPAAWRN